MEDKLRALSRQRKQAHAWLTADGSAVYRAFPEMERAAFAAGAQHINPIGGFQSGLALIQGKGHMQWHIEQAAAAGASRGQVLEAVEFGIEMGGGPATAHARIALAVMDDVFGA